MKHYFLSDAHLLHPNDANYRKFIEFLKHLENKPCSVYFLGDIFHFWVGYRHCVFSAYVPVLQQLLQLHNQGIELCFVEGNHDFNMGEYFRDVLGCRVIEKSAGLKIDGRKVFVAHGDLIDEKDRFYHRWRDFVRNPLCAWLMRRIHPDRIWRIALWAAHQSRRRRKGREASWDPETILTRHASLRFAEGHDAVITGHIHKPWHKETEQGTIISLGDWINHFTYAVCEDGNFSLESF
ncbi:MAG: UDP-2,3-diacylglucosamine diphosphatase [Deltaproteobacteria bacterium]|nr:UDP-2,3-diacylglucosamine diphosphatase [Deltaproteobacteria bacterium]